MKDPFQHPQQIIPNHPTATAFVIRCSKLKFYGFICHWSSYFIATFKLPPETRTHKQQKKTQKIKPETKNRAQFHALQPLSASLELWRRRPPFFDVHSLVASFRSFYWIIKAPFVTFTVADKLGSISAGVSLNEHTRVSVKESWLLLFFIPAMWSV